MISHNITLIGGLGVATDKFSIEMILLDHKKGVAGGNTPLKVYLVALERLCGILTMLREKFCSIVEVCIEKLRLAQK